MPSHITNLGNALTVAVWAGLSTLLAHTVWRVLLRTLRWMQDTYTEAQTQAHLLRDKSAELALALKSLGQTSSQLARSNEQLEIARQHADHARRLKEEFAASVSHELRAPLNLIIGFSDLILREPQVYGIASAGGSSALPSKLMADIALIHRHAQHLLKLVNDILDLSQMDANHLTVQQEVALAAELIDRAVVEYEDLIRQRGLSLDVQIQPDLPEVYADRTRIHQVLLNLLNNALRFTDAGGITITARSQRTENRRQITEYRQQTADGR
ncbi:MAG: sensor histidine kinase [Candidatus Roseilinea sp.]|uniref:sensor histidine kinase n=1 Tax=Candidatus Roseilinea sp. TaxID=2838777 RepID=UPI004049D9D3